MAASTRCDLRERARLARDHHTRFVALASAALLVGCAHPPTEHTPRVVHASRSSTTPPVDAALGPDASPPVDAMPVPPALPPRAPNPPDESARRARVALEQFARVIDMGAGPRVLLDMNPRASWGAGVMRTLVPSSLPEHTLLAERDTNEAALPWHLGGLTGRVMDGYDAQGRVTCTVVLEAPVVLAETSRACLSNCENRWRASSTPRPRESAELVFAARDTVRLVAPFRVESGSCGALRWVRAHDAPAPARTTEGTVSTSLRQSALRAFRASRYHRTQQSNYERAVPRGQRARFWDEHAGSSVTVRLIVEPGGSSRTLWVSAGSIELAGSDNSITGLTLRFAVTSEGAGQRLQLLSSSDDVLRGEEAPAFGLDLDGDGRVEPFNDDGEITDPESPWHEGGGWRGRACLCFG